MEPTPCLGVILILNLDRSERQVILDRLVLTLQFSHLGFQLPNLFPQPFDFLGLSGLVTNQTSGRRLLGPRPAAGPRPRNPLPLTVAASLPSSHLLRKIGRAHV